MVIVQDDCTIYIPVFARISLFYSTNCLAHLPYLCLAFIDMVEPLAESGHIQAIIRTCLPLLSSNVSRT